MWEIYDRLISQIPEGLTADDCISGSNWTMVRSGKLFGVALTVKSHGGGHRSFKGAVKGARLLDIAALCKSWNFTEASIGMAAINAFFNTVENARELNDAAEGKRGENTFDFYAQDIAGKNVAVIGHFPNIESRLGPICNLAVLERNPESGDYPDSACEYILPDCEAVFITGMTFTNKTLPRLLQLCGGAKVTLVGPSVPLAPLLYEYGVDHLSSFCVTCPDIVENCIRQGTRREIFAGGIMTDCSSK